MIEHHFITYKNSRLHYKKEGDAQEVLLCFHGYGWNCYNFDYIMPALLTKYTVYSFDLFAHGESEWNENHELSLDDFKNIFNQFFQSNSTSTFSVLGYSLGGRWATTLLHQFDTRTKELYLIAADGLQELTIVDILSKLKQTNKIIGYFIEHPNLVFGGIKMGYYLGMIDKEAMTFYLEKNATKEKRALLMKRILLCKNLLMPKEELTLKIRRNNISLHLFYGTHDLIMPVMLTATLTKAFGEKVLHKIDDDHLLILKPKLLEAIMKVLTQK
ncbi:MAG: alpha/beta hydrolase [Bacteroidetes bacterium]|nr:alpha/beta hydrolase [Bacteroidota bacterium]